jgi:hypothetical protein
VTPLSGHVPARAVAREALGDAAFRLDRCEQRQRP